VATPCAAMRNDKSALALPDIGMGFGCPQMCQICVRFTRWIFSPVCARGETWRPESFKENGATTDSR
jgi:hypothetical protein